MFSLDEFAQLRFLEGRWKGRSPDGKERQYTLRMRRMQRVGA